ncbi:hypothetical protein L6654_40270 [Bradyrhizobium sp. WYCCWR 13023]|uniref:Uncharacterized protein n=1 Tax=Bradyrhizobium zhengyangense TaxID=2911009 RepID=A0A9X1REF1_9BRAD|nr:MULTISPECIES: hypothetical protein [Bradyrhizobium]MCG2632827.1 hypothetical protein [Bradyrhizobium zhengyangense]MCG2645624.1 hypothetical protein [Bradyrhizobium zhengyangense]MCG2673185.1 hypothetical protein [Bradyrhizobium zhengyangense]MDA9519164.1 hypothetical protein [Bradyrhizobium sp. CCBAU 11434]
MRIMMTSALGLLALASLSVAAEARPCPAGWVRVCQQSPPGRPPLCHCEPQQTQGGNAPWGNQGKAEIHKHNVPTAKPNKSSGPND